ncbi:adenosine 3'-phospho 5'-phosphosulfate transporter 2-like [Argonauta hians]
MTRYRELSNISQDSSGTENHQPQNSPPIQPQSLSLPAVPLSHSQSVYHNQYYQQSQHYPYSSQLPNKRNSDNNCPYSANQSNFSSTIASPVYRDSNSVINLSSHLYYHANSQVRPYSMVHDSCKQNQDDSDEQKDNEQKATMEILCFDLSTLSRSVQFLICSGSVFFFYLIYGYIMELIFRLEGFRPFGWFLTLLQFAWYSVFSILESILKKEGRRKAPLKTYSLLALISVTTIGLSNSSMGYLNFPTQQIFKSCKLIPVMIGGIIIQGKRYGVVDVLACISMCVGLALFTIADSTVSPNFNLYGICMILMALCADAVIGNVQEKVLKRFNCSNIEMVLYSCSIGFVYILAALLITGNLFPAVYFCYEHPIPTYGYSFIFSIAGYLGLISVLTLVKSFGALIAVTVTTCRKALTIVLSFIFFTKPFTIHYLWSGLIVILGIIMNVYSKNQQNFNSFLAPLLKKLFHRKTKTTGLERII